MPLSWLIFGISGLFSLLSLWIVVSAPTFFLLPLGIAAPELSPWLLVANAIALGVNLVYGKNLNFALLCSLLSLGLSLLPLVQFPSANQRMAAEMEARLGKDYLNPVSQSLQTQLRPRPLVLSEVFSGIPLGAVRCQRGIVFANPDGVNLTLNSYLPPLPGKYPGIVIIYGGAWQTGSPERGESMSRYLAAQGYAAIAISYRHAPQYQFPAQLEDVQAALSYIQDHADELEVNLQRMAVLGRSAGAQLAMLAAYQGNLMPLRAVVNYYGPADLQRGYNELPFPDPINVRGVLKAFLGGSPEERPELYRKASPIHALRPGLPPTLLVYARRDRLVKVEFGRGLYEALRDSQNVAVWLEIPWAEHAFDAVFSGIGNQLSLYYVERFLAWALAEG
ncbi:MAG: alpha/beta hydrolase [Chloroflexaceae bacterium]|nr:alpha/beta hydrolase [Chloroflexaceae bacterium]